MKLLLYHRGTAEGDEMSGGALLYALLWWWMDGWTGCLLNLIAIGQCRESESIGVAVSNKRSRPALAVTWN